MLSLIGCSNNNSTAQVTEKEFFLCKSPKISDYTVDLYLEVSEQEREKIESKIDAFKYLRKSNAYLLWEKVDALYYDLYLKKAGEEKQKICSDTWINSIDVTPDESKIYYMTLNNSETESGNFYSYKLIDNENKEEEKIHSKVINYEVLLNGVVYTTEDYELYVKKEGEESKKIATNVYDEMYAIKTGDMICFVKVDPDCFYVRNVNDEENIKITSDPVNDVLVTDNKVFYLTEYDEISETGELYCYGYKKEPKKIAFDVKNYKISEDGEVIFYCNNEDELYTYKFSKDDKEKLAEEIDDYIMDKKGQMVAYKDKDGNVYLKEAGKDKEKIGFDCIAWDGAQGKIVYLNSDQDLYSFESGKEKEKIATEVQSFALSPYGNSLAFCTKDGELFLKEYGKENQKILENIDEYYKIYLGNSLLHERKLKYKDLIGKYKLKDNPYSYISEMYISFYPDDKVTVMYEATGESFDSYIVEYIGQTKNAGKLIMSDGEEIQAEFKDEDILSLRSDIEHFEFKKVN